MTVSRPKYALALLCLLTGLTALAVASDAPTSRTDRTQPPPPVRVPDTATTTGTVDAAAVTAPAWQSTAFSTTTTGTISGTLDWNGTGDLNLFLQVREDDGSWTGEAAAVSAKGSERIAVRDAPPGVYRFGVKARTGVGDFTLTYRFPVGEDERPFLTLLFSRSEITVADECRQADAAVARLDAVVAPELHRRGLRPTGTVQTAGTGETARQCVHNGRSLAASWADLAALRDDHGWTFVSHSRHDNQRIAELSPADQWTETCGSQLDLQEHGHHDGDGFFAWPNNKFDVGVQTDVISSCFAFGRKYRPTPGVRHEVTSPPHWQSAEGISGGKCNDPSLPCSTIDVDRTYESPHFYVDLIRGLRADQWFTMQSYVLVTDHRPGLWDCRSADWRAHWTVDAERYCYRDYLTVLDAIPPHVLVTDPKTVARAWGRTDYAVPAA